MDERLSVAQDANYNVVAIFDNSGSVVERYAYDPFGSVTVLDADFNLKPGGSDYAWFHLHQGGRHDSVSGLYHFRHRDYSPTLGRWTSLDPIRYAAGDVNLYRALGNNPVNRVDPSGLDWLDWVQGGLDVVGVFDPTPLSDGTNALISLGRGDWTGAGLSAISMIPYAGDVIGKGGKAVRYGKKTVDAIEAAKPAAKQTVAPTTGTTFTTLEGGRVGPEFNPQQLQRILRNLERQGVVIDTGADALRLLERQGAGAMYIVGNGRRGTLILRPGATRLEVMEELVHHGQHVWARLQIPTDIAALRRVQVEREIEAQDILLRIARKQNWTAEEIARITVNREVWVQERARLMGR